MNDDTTLWDAIRWLQNDLQDLRRENKRLREELRKLKSDMMSRTDPRLFDGH